MKQVWIAMLAAAIASVPAHSKLLTLTFSGTLSSGTDETGVFGAANSDLTGSSATVRFFIDTSLGTQSTNMSGGIIDSVDYIGGYFYPAASPVISGAISVGGITHIVDNPIFGEFSQYIAPATIGDRVEASISQLSENQSGLTLHFDSISGFSQSFSGAQFLPVGFGNPFSYVPMRGDVGGVTFEVNAVDRATFDRLEFANGVFTPYLITLSATAVPEPRTWTMMGCGLGYIGWKSRRRKTLASAAC